MFERLCQFNTSSCTVVPKKRSASRQVVVGSTDHSGHIVAGINPTVKLITWWSCSNPQGYCYPSSYPLALRLENQVNETTTEYSNNASSNFVSVMLYTLIHQVRICRTLVVLFRPSYLASHVVLGRRLVRQRLKLTEPMIKHSPSLPRTNSVKQREILSTR